MPDVAAQLKGPALEDGLQVVQHASDDPEDGFEVVQQPLGGWQPVDSPLMISLDPPSSCTLSDQLEELQLGGLQLERCTKRLCSLVGEMIVREVDAAKLWRCVRSQQQLGRED